MLCWKKLKMYICQVKGPSAAGEAAGSVPSGPLGEFSGEVSIEFAVMKLSTEMENLGERCVHGTSTCFYLWIA